ncbi:MAG: alpha/beta hydrolase family protein [Chromatiaceae bacterium]|nr:alpha/beta hydrolase family protein [Chromatiaceae bacterium]
MKTIAALILACLILPIAAAQEPSEPPVSSDFEKEQRWREQIVDSLMDGEAIDLDADGQTMLGLYTEAEPDTGRAAVIVHGIGVHPNWPQVVYPLRVGLPERGWSTLSVQMPVLANDATGADYAALMDEVAPRLEAAIAYLRAQGAGQVVLIAHSLGATMSNQYLAQHPQAAEAFVAIGLSSGGNHAGVDNEALIGRIPVPIMDLFGQHDLEAVVSGAPGRAEAAAVNAGYRQVQTAEADHFFDGQDEVLVESVSGWLDEVVSAGE